MVTINIDTVEFELKEYYDFSWLHTYGNVFCVFAQNDSGNISFGVDNGNEKHFIKIAGVNTVKSIIKPEEAVKTLKHAMPLYKELEHPNLIEIVEHYALGNMYVAVFKWAEGECLFDHWNFKKYHENPHIKSPALKFKELSIVKRIESLNRIFSFLMNVTDKDYVAIDFYDGSIIYDFETYTTTICDIDFFRKKPTVNDVGINFWGTKRFKSPEEYIYGAVIDEFTTVYTLGALIFNFFGSYTNIEISEIYKNNMFYPCSLDNWVLSNRLFEVALKAVDADRDKRYNSLSEFYNKWNASLHSK